MFRVNILAFWLACNAAFAITIETYGQLTQTDAGDGKVRINDGQMNFIQAFAIFLAGIVVFRLSFALITLCKFKFFACCSKKYKLHTFNMQEEFATMRQQAKNWDESVLDRTDA